MGFFFSYFPIQIVLNITVLILHHMGRAFGITCMYTTEKCLTRMYTSDFRGRSQHLLSQCDEKISKVNFAPKSLIKWLTSFFSVTPISKLWLLPRNFLFYTNRCSFWVPCTCLMSKRVSYCTQWRCIEIFRASKIKLW